MADTLSTALSPRPMTPTKTPTKKGAALPQGGAKGRISPPLRKAMKLRVERNLTIAEACEKAGFSEAGWHKAMMRPNVRQELESLTNAFISRVEGMKAFYKARAYELAAEMMDKAGTNAEKWKAVEFFTREAKNTGPSVTVNVESPGYAYRRPGERVIDITPEHGNLGASDDAE